MNGSSLRSASCNPWRPDGKRPYPWGTWTTPEPFGPRRRRKPSSPFLAPTIHQTLSRMEPPCRWPPLTFPEARQPPIRSVRCASAPNSAGTMGRRSPAPWRASKRPRVTSGTSSASWSGWRLAWEQRRAGCSRRGRRCGVASTDSAHWARRMPSWSRTACTTGWPRCSRSAASARRYLVRSVSCFGRRTRATSASGLDLLLGGSVPLDEGRVLHPAGHFPFQADGSTMANVAEIDGLLQDACHLINRKLRRTPNRTLRPPSAGMGTISCGSP